MLLSLFALMLLLSIITHTTATTPPYTATDFILLSCGASANSNDTSGRLWNSDELSRYAPSNAAAISSASPASEMDSSVSPVPYQTARVFRSSFTYTFPVSKGPKFLRLYFYPDLYSGFNASQSYFSLTANAFTLLTNFSAHLYSKNTSQPSFIKEFVIHADQETQKLRLTFSPNPNSFAFVNGVEVVSMPDKLYFKGNDVKIKTGDQPDYLKDNTALENLYRINVGAGYVDITNDTGMYRAWNPDLEYMYYAQHHWERHTNNLNISYPEQTPPYTAPALVYTSARVMNELSKSIVWGFAVDAGFSYLLRLHFCEFMDNVTEPFQRVFDVSLDDKMVDSGIDIVDLAGGPLIPIYKDYMFRVLDYAGGRGRQDLLLTLSPNTEGPIVRVPLLNGLEIFKLNNTKGSLAAPNPEFVPDSSSPLPPPPVKKSGGSSSMIIYPVVGSVAGVVAVVAVVGLLILRRRRRVKDSGTTSVTKSSWIPLSIGSRSTARTSRSGVSLPADICRYFSIDEIKTATRNFDENFIIGRGGFGNVYKGLIDNAATTVAVKRLNTSSRQGAHEFLTEIDMLSKLRHLHLVSLIGYCDDDGEMILVYDYMAHGTLRDHLYNSENQPLNWKQRLQICLGAAKGLDYLHTGAKHAIIHRDVKSTNILLDEKWVAKMSDFGLSKVGPAAGGQTHVSTVVKGSFGYVDPEYYRRQQLTLKSDVYSFGVVLFEVLCARPAIIPTLPREQVNLGEWAKFCFRKGTLDQIIDSNLDGQIAPECLSKFVETAASCLKDKGIDRPSMNDIVWSLEFAMQLQISAESGGGSVAEGEGDNFVAVSPSSLPLLDVSASTTTNGETFSLSKSSDFSMSSSEKIKSGDAFSELMNPSAR